MGLQWNLHAQESRADELARVLRSGWGGAQRLVAVGRVQGDRRPGAPQPHGTVSGLGATALVID